MNAIGRPGPAKGAEPTTGRGARKPITVLIVDDSRTIRALIRARLAQEPDIKVVAEAVHPLEARDAIKTHRPDVVTLDVEMPHMDGLTFLKKVMSLRPMPIIMLSTLTHKGSEIALEALRHGALDCIGKSPDMTRDGTLDTLVDMIRAAAVAQVRSGVATLAPASPMARSTDYAWGGRHVLIGASTGGVDALEQVLSALPPNCPPIAIVQHMPETFLRSFARRLDERCSPYVRLAETGLPLKQGQVVIAPGGATHLELDTRRTTPTCVLREAGKVSGHRPSVDVLFDSASNIASSCAAIILTGMGHDGAAGQRRLSERGALTLAQDEATSVVFGMPRVALETGGASEAVPLGQIANRLLSLTAATPRAT